jgi:hypothetical protein
MGRGLGKECIVRSFSFSCIVNVRFGSVLHRLHEPSRQLAPDNRHKRIATVSRFKIERSLGRRRFKEETIRITESPVRADIHISTAGG